jgi:hypothetical protein
MPALRSVLPWLLLLFAFTARGEQRFALLIGANAGWADDRPLRYAESDAQRVRDVLVELGGFPEEHVQLLKEPDTAQVREALHRLTEAVKAAGEQESLVVFYYSGHADEQHVHLRGTPLSHAELYEALRDLPATLRLGVLDACRSGSILAAKGGRRASAFNVRVVNELSVRGLALLTSSGADELSQETRSLAGSVFTHHWVSGLRGAGDFDKDGAVTLSEAYRYAYQRTEAATAATGSPHRPAFHFELAGQGEPILTRPRRGETQLLLPTSEGERYVVVDEHQVRLVAEGYTRADEQVTLALAPGTYHVTHVQKDQLAVATIFVERGVRVLAKSLAYVTRPLSTGLLKGNPDELEGEELLEWRRGEALRLLDAGEAQAALNLFDELLAQRPDDLGMRRGRVRALVRLAEEHSRRNDKTREYAVLSQAVEAEPSLAEDPAFTDRYQRLREVSEEMKVARRQSAEQTLLFNPRLIRRWGFGIDGISPRGLGAPWVAMTIQDDWYPYLALDFFGRGVDVGIRYVPRSPVAAMTPFFSAGTHISLALLGLFPFPDSFSREAASVQFMWGHTLHVETGFLYMGETGIFFDFGVGMVLYAYPPEQALGIFPMAHGGMGWFF